MRRGDLSGAAGRCAASCIATARNAASRAATILPRPTSPTAASRSPAATCCIGIAASAKARRGFCRNCGSAPVLEAQGARISVGNGRGVQPADRARGRLSHLRGGQGRLLRDRRRPAAIRAQSTPSIKVAEIEPAGRDRLRLLNRVVKTAGLFSCRQNAYVWDRRNQWLPFPRSSFRTADPTSSSAIQPPAATWRRCRR